MPNNSPAIIIVGHGAASGKGQLIDYFGYHVLLPVKEGHSFDVMSYNILLSSLLVANDAPSLHRSLQILEALPTTVVVDKGNKKHHILQQGVDLAEADPREALFGEIKRIREIARDSQESWELLEHKISPASDILTHPHVLKLDVRPHYEAFRVMNADFAKAVSQGTAGGTFVIAFDTEHVKDQAKAIQAANSQHKDLTAPLDARHFLHITPYMVNVADSPSILLSEILKSLSEVHIIVRVVSNAHQQEASLYNIIFNDFKQEADYLAGVSAIDTSDTCWVDLTIPDDSNVILGACRNLDSSF